MSSPRNCLDEEDFKRPGYVFIRFERSLLQTFKNRMVASGSIIRNYGGTVLSIAPEITVKEGEWPKNCTLGVLFFRTIDGAKRYLDSEPVIKQPDFVNGPDILVVPMEHVPQSSKPVFCLIDLCVHENEKFCNDYVPGHMPGLKAHGATPAVVASKKFYKKRGLWSPRMIVVHQFATKDQFEKWYNSEDYQPFKGLRHQIATTTMVAFENDFCDRCDAVSN